MDKNVADTSEIIRLDNVCITVDGKEILKNINWKVNQKENWAILGRNGAGKSFLLRLLSADLHPSSGNVFIFGKKLGEISIWDLKKSIGIVSDKLQRDYVENATVLEVIYSGFFSSIGLYDEITDKMKKSVEDILDFLEINHLKEKMFGNLSHGEQRKCIIARALVFNPKILVFDEPCTSLDPASREELLKTLSNLARRGHNIILVTHHIEEIIPEINHIALIKNGKLVCEGDKKDIIHDCLAELIGKNHFLVEKNGRYFTMPN